MSEKILQRLEALREVMQREHLGAFIFPSSDPHQSEYTADYWKGREFISGFNGSAGTAVVTMHSAALWTDSRYFIAAEQQLAGTGIQLMRLKMPDTPTIAEWIGSQLLHPSPVTTHPSPSTEVGVDGTVCSASMVDELIGDLRRQGGLTVRTNLDPLKTIWKDRPSIPMQPVEILSLQYTGEPASKKLERIRQSLRIKHADGMLMASLDDIAWTLNLRGTDVHCTPVFIAYLLISTTTATLYIHRQKVSAEVIAYLQAEGVAVDDYDHVSQGLKDYFEYNILLDPDEVNYALFQVVRNKELWNKEKLADRIIKEESPVKRMKTVKNEAEIAGLRQAMLKDGIAMVKFLRWLDNTTVANLTELAVDRKLTTLRAEQSLFRDISFDTIAAYGVHGAIVHYEPTPDTDIPLKAEGLLLLDSGAQYLDGTTDITRTIALGPLTDEMKHIYTLVLKGHIQIELAQFPSGISGTQLDVLAKRAMWQEGYSYLHGTGHGVGSYLCVHEGPHQIRMEWKPAPLVAGMTVTDEPGIYLEGRFGARIENTLLIVPSMTTEFGQFLRFESLTLCPIDKRPIVVDMLTDEERQWLNDYHQMVYNRLSPYLDEAERAWLKDATSAVED